MVSKEVTKLIEVQAKNRLVAKLIEEKVEQKLKAIRKIVLSAAENILKEV